MAFKKISNLMHGVMGNLSEQNLEDLYEEYGNMLIDGEEIRCGYKLVRDAVLFTNIRILFKERQGTTGAKTSYKNIYMMNIVDVEMETAGFGLDDSEIVITYMTNVFKKTHSESLAVKKFEFPKKVDIVPLYNDLLGVAYENRLGINGE